MRTAEAQSKDYFTDEGQGELDIDDENDEEGDELSSRRWNVELKLKLSKVDSKNSFAMNLLSGDYPRETIAEVLKLATNTRRLNRILDALLTDIQESSETHQ